MYQIGKFSKLTNVSIRTLRYYDAINLLKPSYVDQFTNYRYYTDIDKDNLDYILYLKSVGYSLEEIIINKENMNDEIIDNKIIELELQKEEIENKIIELKSMKSSKVLKKVA